MNFVILGAIVRFTSVAVVNRSSMKSASLKLARIALAGILALGLPQIASAQSSDEDDDGVGKGLAPFTSDGPLLAVVSLAQQRINIWDRNGIVASAPVSTGRKGYDTPEGIFSVIERKEEHYSNLYDDAAMPFMQRITWSGVALHAGVVPGYRASHGCIRLPEDFAERLFRTTRIATRVAVVPHAGQPTRISHAAIFGAISAPPQSTAPAVVRGALAIGGADGADGPPMMLGARYVPRPAAATPTSSAAEAGDVIRPALPSVASVSSLKQEQAAINRLLAAATRDVERVKAGVRPRLLEQGRTEKALRQAIALSRRAEGRATSLGKAADAARGERAIAAARTAHIEAMMALATARGREQAARALAEQKAASAAEAQAVVKAAEARRQQLAEESRALLRRMQPVTVLISRQTGRVYLRQAFNALAEMPVDIASSDRPIGTHLFTAVEGEDGGLDWLGLTIETPGGGIPPGAEPPPAASKRKRHHHEVEVRQRPAADSLASARAALQRVRLPQEALAKIMPSLHPGSTLIISDLGPSIETGRGTDLIVQTRGEEQAAASIAKFVAKKKAEQGFESASYKPDGRRREARRVGDWQRW